MDIQSELLAVPRNTMKKVFIEKRFNKRNFRKINDMDIIYNS